MGFGELELIDLVVPGITVIAQNPGQISAVAAQRLFERLDLDHSPATTVTLPIRLVERAPERSPPPRTDGADPASSTRGWGRRRWRRRLRAAGEGGTGRGSRRDGGSVPA